MKTFILKTLSMTLLITLTSSCLKSEFGKKEQEADTGLVEDNNEDTIAAYTPEDSKSLANNHLSKSRSLASTGELDFLDNVVSASITINKDKMTVKLFDPEGNRVRIPASYAQNARFKSNVDFVIITSISTSSSIVIDRSSQKVYLTKGSDLAYLDLSSLSKTTLKINGQTTNVTKVKALVSDESQDSTAGSIVYVGLRIENNRLKAYRMNQSSNHRIKFSPTPWKETSKGSFFSKYEKAQDLLKPKAISSDSWMRRGEFRHTRRTNFFKYTQS